MKIRKFFYNATLMVLTTVILRIASLVFSVYLSRVVGEEGIGIYQLTLSVYRLGITLSSAGIGFAATRIIAEEIEKNNPREALRAAERCLFLSFGFGIAVAVLFLLFADFFATSYLGDPRCALSIRAMAISFPFVVMSSVIMSYFTAVARVSKNAAGLLVDQTVRIVVTYIMLRGFDGKNLEYACLSLAVGGIFAEVVSFLFSFIFYSKDKSTLMTGRHLKTKLGGRISYIALPVATSSFIRSGLLSIEHMMIPRGLKKRGVDASRAMGLYGMISGMVFPVIMFPSAFLYAASDLLVPEFAACHASGDDIRLKRLTGKVMQLTSFFAVGVAGILFGFSHETGMVFYNSADCGKYIKMLAPLVVFMLYDHLADAILKGLDEQVSVVKYNIIDSVTSVVLVWFLVPIFGLSGYVFVVWFGEVMNCVMSGTRLVKCTGVPIRLTLWFLRPTFAISLSVFLTRSILVLIHGGVGESLFSLIVAFLITSLLYLLIMRIMGCIRLSDYKLLKNALTH